MKANLQNCPNCHQLIDVGRAVGMSGWSRLMPRTLGVRCPKCKKVVAASQRSSWRFWVLFLLGFGLVLVGQINGHLSKPVAVLFQVILAVVALLRRHPPVILRQPPAGVSLLEATPSTREYEYLEGRGARAEEFRPDSQSVESESADWACANCRQPNPASFDVCWKCNHPKRLNGG